MSDDLPTAKCPGCGQVTFGAKFPTLSVEYDGEERSTRFCRECVESPFAVLNWIKQNGGVPDA